MQYIILGSLNYTPTILYPLLTSPYIIYHISYTIGKTVYRNGRPENVKISVELPDLLSELDLEEYIQELITIGMYTTHYTVCIYVE